jgi:hypothetical protein
LPKSGHSSESFQFSLARERTERGFVKLVHGHGLGLDWILDTARDHHF